MQRFLKKRVLAAVLAALALVGFGAVPAHANIPISPGTCELELSFQGDWLVWVCLSADGTTLEAYQDYSPPNTTVIEWTAPDGQTYTTGPVDSDTFAVHEFPGPAADGTYTLTFRARHVEDVDWFWTPTVLSYAVSGFVGPQEPALPKGTIDACPRGKPNWVDGTPKNGSGAVLDDGLIQRWECTK